MRKICVTVEILQGFGFFFFSFFYKHKSYQSPPQSISVGFKLVIQLLLYRVDQERGQDQTEEADVPGCDELLKKNTCSKQKETGDKICRASQREDVQSFSLFSVCCSSSHNVSNELVAPLPELHYWLDDSNNTIK